jgi:LCP family protein required for cell wall assembly
MKSPERGRGFRVWLLVLGAVLSLTAAGALLLPAHRIAGDITRLPAVFDSLGIRPAAATAPANPILRPLTFLLVGSDSPAPRLASGWPRGRSDVIMLARLTADRLHAQVISIPRDAWVPVPGHGLAKINAAYAWGGPRLLVQTVEQLTKTRIDHFAAIDFAGLASVVDTLGGVTVAVAESTSAGGSTFVAGDNALDGERSVHYVRQRHGLPLGDLDRVHRHQQMLGAIWSRLESGGLWRDLASGDRRLTALVRAVQVDDRLTDLELARIAYEARHLERVNVRFMTAPVAGFGCEGLASVVYLDSTRSSLMWRLLRGDSLASQLPSFTAELLPERPR